MGLFGGILKVGGLLVLALVGLGAFLYFTDYAAQGEIVEKGRDAEGQYVVIQPRYVPYEITKHLDSRSADFVCEGYQVIYRLQTGRYTVSDGQGRIVYDSESGLTDLFSPIRCGTLLG
ncbi:MAG TPA: hypothetical protein VFH78_11735 [Candidatus Thermoplasmatota archaeon]|nr:hypothetical protein [Candidatus Thermoplasmatota archaeon]